MTILQTNCLCSNTFSQTKRVILLMYLSQDFESFFSFFLYSTETTISTTNQDKNNPGVIRKKKPEGTKKNSKSHFRVQWIHFTKVDFKHFWLQIIVLCYLVTRHAYFMVVKFYILNYIVLKWRGVSFSKMIGWFQLIGGVNSFISFIIPPFF